MRKSIITSALCLVSAFALVYVAYGQSQEDMDNLKESKRHIELLEKVQQTIDNILYDQRPPDRIKELKFIDVSDIMIKVPDYAGPDVRVFNPEASPTGGVVGGGIVTWGGDEDYESFEGRLDPDELIELIRARTGEEEWPEEEGGFGTIEYHRGKLIICNTPEIIKEAEKTLSEIRGNLPALITSSVYLLAADEEYLLEVRRKGYSAVKPGEIRKILKDCEAGEKIKLLQAGYLSAHSSQSAYLYTGMLHTYIGDTDTSGGGGISEVCVCDPIISIFREGLIISLRAQYNRHTKRINLVANVSLSKLTSLESHTGVEKGEKDEFQTYTVETPKVDLQVVSGSSDVPEGYGLLIGGSRLRTTQAKQKSFIVLVVPEIQK